MALQAIGNVNLEFSNTGYTNTVSIVYTQNNITTWVSAEGLEGVNPSGPSAPDIDNYRVIPDYGSATVIDSNDNVILLYSQRKNSTNAHHKYIMLVKRDLKGNLIWRKEISHNGIIDPMFVKSMCLDANNDLYILADANGTKDVRIIKLTDKTPSQANLILNLDANNVLSYPGGNNGTVNSRVWYDTSDAKNNAQFITYGGALTHTFTDNGKFSFSTTAHAVIPTIRIRNKQFTFSIWIKTPAAGGLNGKPLLSYYDKRNLVQLQLSSFANDGKMYVNQAPIHNTVVADGKWHHVVAVFDETLNQVTGYVDGVQGITSAYGGKIKDSETKRMTIAAAPLALNGWSDNYYVGDISKVQVYDRALSAQEVSDLYNTWNPEAPRVVWAKNYSISSAAQVSNRSNGSYKIIEKNGKLYAVGKYYGIFCVDSSNGNVAWAQYSNGNDANTQLVYSTVLNGNVYAISESRHYHVHNFNANTGAWNDTKTFFTYQGNVQAYDGLGVVATDGYDLYVRQFETVTRVEGANTNNVIWCNRISHTGNGTALAFRSIWNDLVFDSKPVANSTGNSSANTFITVGFFNRADFGFRSPFFFQVDKDSAEIHTRRFTFGPWLIGDVYSSYWSKKPQVAYSNGVASIAVMSTTAYTLFSFERAFNMFSDGNYQTNFRYGYDSDRSINNIWMEFTGGVSTPLTKPDIRTFNYTWNPISITTTNYSTYTKNPDIIKYPFHNYNITYGNRMKQNPVQEWISDTRQSIGMDADIIINKPNNESYVSAFGANTGWPTGVGVDYYFNKDTQITSLETDSEGYPVTIGQITGFSENYTYYAVLTKWTKNGEVLWSRMISNINEQPYTNSFGGGYDAYAILVRVDKRDDSIYVITQQNVEIYYGAYFLSKFDKNGNFLWNKVLADELYVYDSSQNDISIDDEGNLYVVGQRPTVTSFTANGDYRWAITYSDTYYYNENGLGFVTAYDSNANILLVGESSWANVHAFDSSGNYKWTYTYTNENESSFGIQDVVIDDTQANTWYVIQYDGYGIDGLNGSAINKMQGYEDPQLVSRKYFYLKNPLDWQYETNSFNVPSTSGARFTKIIPKNNSLYLSGGIGRFDGDGGLRFYKFDKDLTTANFNNFFVDENSYTMYTFWWWNDNGSLTKEELFDIDVDGYMVRGGHWEPNQVMGDEVDGERNWSYDERGILVRLPSDGSLSHEWDYNKVNYPFGNIYNPKWRQFSYLAGDKIRARWNGELIPTANIGWFVTDTTNVYGKSTSQSDYFKKNVFFDDFGNLTYGPEDIILSNSNDFITITNTYESHFYNVTYHPITTGKFITLDYPYVPQTNTNTSSKLLDISSNVIQVNTVPLINANSTYKSWVHTSMRYDANVYTGGSSNYYGIYGPYYHFGTDAKVDNSNNIILIDQNSLHTNGNGVTVGITKFNEYGSKIWSYCFPASWEGTDNFGQIDSLTAGGATIDENNNIYVLGERTYSTSPATSSKCIVAKLDPNGNLLWAKSYPDQGNYYTNLRYDNGVLLMVRSGINFAARGPAVLYRLNPNNGDIIWAVNKNSSAPISFHGVKVHNNTILLGAEDGFYYAFDLNGNQLFARSLGGSYFGPSVFEIGDIASDDTDYYLADRVGWIHKIDGTTHNVKWSTLVLLAYGAAYPRITYMNGYIHAHVPVSSGQDDYPGVFYVKINPNNGEIVFSRYVALAPGPVKQAEYWQHYNPTWSFGADIKNNIYTFAGGLHLYDREPMGYRILLGKIDLTDNVLEERLYKFKPDYNDAFILNDTRNFTVSGGQNEIGGYYAYNQINGLDNNQVTFANVVTGAAHTFFSVNPATITVENLSGPLRVTPFEVNDANLFVYSSRTDILSKPFVQTSNVSVNTNVSINFYGGLSINSYVRSTRSYDTDSWIASWGGYDHAVQKWVADYNYYEDYGTIGESRLVSMSIDSTGNVWSTGFFKGDQDGDNKAVILKHGANGNLISFYGTSPTQTENIIPYYSATGYNITCDDNDNAYVSIYDDSYLTRPTDALQFAKISKNGNILWKNCIEYPDALYGYVGPSYKLLVDSGANRLFCILLQSDQDLPGIICLNSATGNHLWTKTLNYQDYGGIYLADAVVLNGHLYALAYDALIKFDYDGNIVWSKSIPTGRLLSTDGTDLYLTEYYNNGIYSNVTKITKISGEKLESLDDFESDWETTLQVTDLERLKYEENANSAYLYSNPEIHSVHYDHDKDKIIALGQANLLYSDWTYQQYYYYNYSKIYTFVWQIDPQTGELDHAVRVGNYNGDFIAYQHYNVYEWQPHGQISSSVKNGYVYSCGHLTGSEGFIPFPYDYSVNNSYNDSAIVKFKYTGDKFITAQDTIDSIDTNDLIDGYDGTLNNLGEALFVTKAENTATSPSQHFANIANTNFTFSDFFVTNEYRIFSNTYTGGVIANSANVFIGSQYKANSSQYELPLYTPFHIKRADVINVNSLFVMYKGNVGVSENINAELNTRILSNTTNARDSLIQSSTYRERIIQATVPANGNVVIDLSIGNIFAYRRLQGSQTTNTINNIIIIQSGNVRNSNSLVQSFTLFTNGIGRIANSTWANANIAWPRFDVPRGPTGNSIHKYSFMKVPQSNLWYGFAQANTVNITFSKVKVLNAPANTSESITGTPIWGYDTPNGNNALIVKFNDATICGGSNTYSGVKQESTYTFSFESESELYLRSLNVASNVESGRDGYDRLKIVYTRIAFDGVTQTVIYEAFSQNTANILTCIGRSAYVNISPPYNLVLSSNTYHKFDLIANSVDALYHSDSQYNIQFDFRKRDN